MGVEKEAGLAGPATLAYRQPFGACFLNDLARGLETPSQPAESAPLTSGNRALRDVKRGDFRFRSGGLAQLLGSPVLAGFPRVLAEDQAGGRCRPGARV